MQTRHVVHRTVLYEAHCIDTRNKLHTLAFALQIDFGADFV